MNTSSRFVVAIHVLAAMALDSDKPLKSERLSRSVNTNAVVIRRILGLLRAAGLVVSQAGPDGGFRLARESRAISLLDIYQAVEEGELFHMHYSEPSCDCPIGAYVQDSLGQVFKDADTAMKKVLRGQTLATVTREILQRSGISEKLDEGWTIDELHRHFSFESGRLVLKKT